MTRACSLGGFEIRVLKYLDQNQKALEKHQEDLNKEFDHVKKEATEDSNKVIDLTHQALENIVHQVKFIKC